MSLEVLAIGVLSASQPQTMFLLYHWKILPASYTTITGNKLSQKRAVRAYTPAAILADAIFSPFVGKWLFGYLVAVT